MAEKTRLVALLNSLTAGPRSILAEPTRGSCPSGKSERLESKSPACGHGWLGIVLGLTMSSGTFVEEYRIEHQSSRSSISGYQADLNQLTSLSTHSLHQHLPRCISTAVSPVFTLDSFSLQYSSYIPFKMKFTPVLLGLASSTLVRSQTTASTTTPTASAAPSPTESTGCELHGDHW